MSGNERPALVFSLNWKISLASAIFFPILIYLGLWQLGRAEEKQTILDEWYIQQALPPVIVKRLDALKAENNSIQLKGHFDQTQYWLFENRFFKGKLGYEVLMVLTTETGERILVNRGWVPASAYREELPVFATPDYVLSVQGILKDPADYKMLKDKGEFADAWPKRIVEINLSTMSEHYGEILHPKLLKLNLESEGALAVTNEKPINMTPAKHRAYAFQWFALAFALCILWLVANSNITQVLKK